MLRCHSIASLKRTVSTPPLVDFSRASHLDLFEQPAGAFFSTLLELLVVFIASSPAVTAAMLGGDAEIGLTGGEGMIRA